jgi:DNA-binding transcriptional LysR family regulator
MAAHRTKCNAGAKGKPDKPPRYAEPTAESARRNRPSRRSRQTNGTEAMKLTVQQLRYILKTSETGSLTEASKALGVSQATLSSTITQVEEYVGFKVFLRGRRGAQPTERGFDFLGYARRAVSAMDVMEARFGHAENAELTFSVTGQNFAFAEWTLGDLAKLSEFATYDCSYYIEPLSRSVRLVTSGTCDMGLAHMRNDSAASTLRVIANAGLSYHDLLRITPHALMTPSHPLANRATVKPADLEPYPEYQLEQYLQLNDPDKWPDQGPMSPYNGIKVYDASVSVGNLVRSIAEIEGYAVWGNVRAAEMTESGVVAIPIETDDLIRIGYFVPDDAVQSPIEKRYLAELRAVAKGN